MRKKFVFSLVAFVSALLFVFSGNTVYAETIPDKPPLTGVYDPHGYLSDDVIKEVAVLNQSYSKTELKPQIAVAIVDEVDGNIESVANETAKKWQVGFSDTNYGALVLVSVKERKIRTETSNNMGLIIPDSEAKLLNDSVKDDFRKEDYSAGVLKYISLFKSKIDAYSDGEGQNPEDTKSDFTEKIDLGVYMPIWIIYGIILVIILIMIFMNEMNNISLRRRMNYDYDGKDKMYPDNPYFIPNESWTEERIEEYERQKAEGFALRSDYYYEGNDKLEPGDANFVEGAWTPEQLQDHYLKLSNYSYRGKDKLYPNNPNFVDNPTWTAELIRVFYAENSHYSGHSHSSSSYSSSSSSWSGGGFGGGGATGDW